VRTSVSLAWPTLPRESVKLHSSAEPPIFWIVAGPNGSGKSSFYQTLEFQASARSIWIINPDLLTIRLQQVEGLELQDANLQAVKRIEAWLEVSIRAHQTVGVETVLSTDKYRRLVVAARALQFQIRLAYLILDSPEHNIERVRMRVKKGGHAVPEDKIVKRYARSLKQMPWFLDQADEAWLYDNSDISPRLIGRKHAGVITLDSDALPQVVAAVETIKTS
jgi:predicted ABC-type ATPase